MAARSTGGSEEAHFGVSTSDRPGDDADARCRTGLNRRERDEMAVPSTGGSEEAHFGASTSDRPGDDADARRSRIDYPDGPMLDGWPHPQRENDPAFTGSSRETWATWRPSTERTPFGIETGRRKLEGFDDQRSEARWMLGARKRARRRTTGAPHKRATKRRRRRSP